MKLNQQMRDAITLWFNYQTLAKLARADDIDASPELVKRHYRRFMQWWEGEITTDYLIKVTGIRKIKETTP